MAPHELYTIEEAERIKRAYSCWLNKAAHIGSGRIGILTDITVKRKRNTKNVVDRNKKYTVLFQFTRTIKLSAFEFLVNNGLVSPASDFNEYQKQSRAQNN